MGINKPELIHDRRVRRGAPGDSTPISEILIIPGRPRYMTVEVFAEADIAGPIVARHWG